MKPQNNRQVHYDAEKAIALAKGVQDWQAIPVESKCSSPQSIDDPYAIISNGELRGYEGQNGLHQLRVFVKNIADYLPRNEKPLQKDKRYILEVRINGQEVYTLSHPEIRKTFNQAVRQGSRTTTFAQEVA